MEFFNNRASTVYNAPFDGRDNNGVILVQNESGNQMHYDTRQSAPQLDHDPCISLLFFKGERVCSVCAPDTISKLIKKTEHLMEGCVLHQEFLMQKLRENGRVFK